MLPRQLFVKILILLTRANESLIELGLRRVVRSYLLNRHVVLCVVHDLRLMVFLVVVEQIDEIFIVLVELLSYSIELDDRRLLLFFILDWHGLLLFLGLLCGHLTVLVPLLLLARLVEQVDVAGALVASLVGFLVHIEAMVHTLLSAVPSALFVQIVVLVVAVDLLVSRLVLQLAVVLVVDRVEEVVVEGLLTLPLGLLVALVPAVVRLAVLLLAKGLAIQAVHGAWALACVMIERLVLVHGSAAMSCFPVHQVVFGRLRSFRVLRYEGAAVRILNRSAAFNGLTWRQRLLHTLGAEIKTLFIVTQGHRLRQVIICISIEFRHYAVVMVKVSVGRDLVLLSGALLACVVVHLCTALIVSPRPDLGRTLGVSVLCI